MFFSHRCVKTFYISNISIQQSCLAWGLLFSIMQSASNQSLKWNEICFFPWLLSEFAGSFHQSSSEWGSFMDVMAISQSFGCTRGKQNLQWQQTAATNPQVKSRLSRQGKGGASHKGKVQDRCIGSLRPRSVFVVEGKRDAVPSQWIRLASHLHLWQKRHAAIWERPLVLMVWRRQNCFLTTANSRKHVPSTFSPGVCWFGHSMKYTPRTSSFKDFEGVKFY